MNPKSIAIFGANNEYVGTMGAMMLRNIIFGGFPKDKIFPIHPKLDLIQGLKAYKNVIDICMSTHIEREKLNKEISRVLNSRKG